MPATALGLARLTVGGLGGATKSPFAGAAVAAQSRGMGLALRTLEEVVRVMAARTMGTPSIVLGDLRRVAAERVLRSLDARMRALHPGLLAGDPVARTALATLADDAIVAMREGVREESMRRGALSAIASHLDARFADTDATELLDDPDLDRATRVQVLEHLDLLNTIAGSYRSFFDELRPFLRVDGRPTRILDLAAGHGGFALEAARLARHEGLALEIHATDLKREYLDLGSAIAERESLPVRFEIQDALDLSNHAAGAFDVIVCTQSLHHFPAGLVAVLASEASRIAGRGVVLIDGYRSRTHAVLVSGLGIFALRDRAFAHDAWVSFRRFFTPEELGLLARLGPHGARVHARWSRPTHCHVVIDLR